MTEGLHRRQFLGQTALGAAGLTALNSAIARGADEEPSKVVIGVMGMQRGKALAARFITQPGVEIRYTCDTDSGRAEAGASAVEKSGAARPKAIGDFNEILNDPEVDALVCAAPNHWHAPATILACAAGKHVYVEKPCCHNPYEGEVMIQAARKHNRAVQMGSQRRSSANIQKAIQLMHDGAIGRVYSAKAYHSANRGTIGTGKPADVPAELDYELWQGPAPRTPYLDNRVHYNWHWFWHWGNGELGNNGIHSLDLCRWGLGVEYPIKVTSTGGRYAYQDDQQTADTHSVGFEFKDRKAITWQGLSCNGHKDGFATFYGETGTIAIDSSGGFQQFNKTDSVVLEEKGNNGDLEHIVDFINAVRTNEPLKLNAEIEEGHKSTLLCHLGNIAHRTGRTLNCNPDNGHIIGDDAAMKYWKREYEPGWEPQV
ncbi:Inositol 2-dehydrogenase [Polystyrenella longa]|uniref:Inositol 2-dehydrogenase n=1 Tax=Polystyrenella longa TaxID=2528007 RepID=A0A518CR19_9PLAN|nr:Gfo/Idh/MocA family oxidoreductase [Polystyrenella longa]QDU81658.1 Inositol 2-dehydrogenase [Polystyrenella longa]